MSRKKPSRRQGNPSRQQQKPGPKQQKPPRRRRTRGVRGPLIFLAVIAFNLMGDGLRDILDPNAQ